MVKARWKANPSFKPRLSDIINRASPAVGEEATKALRINGEEVTSAIQGLAPEDQGALKESITWNFGDPAPGSLGVRAARRSAALAAIPEHLRISISAGGRKAPHAHLVEYGTDQRFTDDGKSTGAAKAQPFFFVTIRAYQKRMRNRIRRMTRAALKKALQ